MPFVRRRICGPRSDTPAAARSFVHAGSGRIDHDPRAQGRDLAGQQITRADAGDRAAFVPHDLGHLRVVERPRAEAAGREDVLEAEALRENQQVVEVVAGAAKVAGAHRRLERERVDRGQNPIALRACDRA